MSDANLKQNILKDICNLSFDSAMHSICTSLQNNLFDSDLYSYMGLIYQNRNNYNCAYLCFENALQYADNEDSIRKIKEAVKPLLNSNELTLNNFSVIIITRNHLHSTIQCIESLKKNNSSNNYEIILVDNGSTDDTPLWIQSQMGIKYILNPDNNDFASSCNQGIRIANRNNDIYILSSDAIVMPNSIFNLRLALYHDSKAGTASSIKNDKIEINDNRIIYCSKDELDKYYAHALKNNIPDTSRHEYMITSETYSLFIKRDVLNDIGLFNENLIISPHENYNFCLRALKNGYNNIYCKDSFVFYYDFAKEEFHNPQDKKLSDENEFPDTYLWE